jgi:hypothetical protein
MTLKAFRFLFVCSIALAALGASPALAAPDRYRLQFTVTRDGKQDPASEMIVEAGSEGVIEVRSASNPAETYKLQATAMEVEHPKKQAGRWVQVSIQFQERHGDAWKMRAEPWLIAPLREEGAAPASADKLPSFTIQSRSGGSSFQLTLFASVVSEAGLKAWKTARGIPPAAAAQGSGARSSLAPP